MRLFRVYVDGNVFYHPNLSKLAITEAKVSEDAENIDSLTLSAPYNHPYIDSIKPMASVIVCKKGEETVFEGRALDDGSDTYEEMFFDMYTLINGRLSLVTTSGERDRYYLCTDNTIANEGSGSAFNSVRQYYVYTDGQLNLKESVVYDSEKNPQNPWSFNTADSANGVTISESDAYSIMDNYEYTRIPFIALADMK